MINKNIFLFLVVGIFIVIVVGEAVSAIDLHVGSGQTYSTIQACADVAQAGDTCVIHSGTYSSPSLPRDGSPGKWIIFKAADGESPTVTGSWNLGGRDYIEINGFTTGSFSGTNVNNVRIMNNLIQNVHDAISFTASDDILISGNTFNSVLGDVIRQFGERWTIRNNVIIDEDPLDTSGNHFDFWQSWCTSGSIGKYSLIENNAVIDIRGSNVHFALSNDGSGCSEGTRNMIFRYNKVHNIGSMGIYIDNNNPSPNQLNNVIYNNDWSYLVRGNPASWQNYAHSMTASTESIGINNIFSNSLSDGDKGVRGFLWASGGAQSYNLYYDTAGLSNFQGLALNEVGAVKNQNPLLTNPDGNDFSIASNSPARDAGGPLTFVASADSGTGTTLVVEKAEFFQPGWAGADADTIAVGSVSNTVQISSIDYNTDTITLANSISRSDGDEVWLYRDSDGTRVLYGSAPDIGAVEYVSGTGPICGDGTCDTGETCGSCPNDCGSCSICGPADDDSNGIVSTDELIDYISEWKSGNVTIGKLIAAIAEWKNGCQGSKKNETFK